MFLLRCGRAVSALATPPAAFGFAATAPAFSMARIHTWVWRTCSAAFMCPRCTFSAKAVKSNLSWDQLLTYAGIVSQPSCLAIHRRYTSIDQLVLPGEGGAAAYRLK